VFFRLFLCLFNHPFVHFFGVPDCFIPLPFGLGDELIRLFFRNNAQLVPLSDDFRHDVGILFLCCFDDLIPLLQTVPHHFGSLECRQLRGVHFHFFKQCFLLCFVIRKCPLRHGRHIGHNAVDFVILCFCQSALLFQRFGQDFRHPALALLDNLGFFFLCLLETLQQFVFF